MREISRTIRFLITGIAVVLAFFFAWVKLANFPYSTSADVLNPNLTRDFLVAVYYTCWVFGSKSDTLVQEKAYSVKEGALLLPIQAIVFILTFGAMVGVLLWTVHDDVRFTLALDVLFVANILGFFYILRFVRPAIEMSRAKFSQAKDIPNILKLEVVVEYMTGRWQWLRFTTGVLILAVMTVICFVQSLNLLAAAAIAHRIGFAEATVQKLMADALIAVFIFTMEGWIWNRRYSRDLTIRIIERLSDRYEFVGT